jgi:hypothetical protein
LKKSSKKLLVVSTSARPGTLSPEGQKFLVLFSKKNRLLPLVVASADLSVLSGQLPKKNQRAEAEPSKTLLADPPSSAIPERLAAINRLA